MKHPSLVYLVLCLWCWAPLAQLKAIPLSVFLGGSPPSASSLPAASNVLAWYALESNGADSSGNGYTMTGTGTPAHGTGKVGNAFTSGGTSQWYSITNAAWQSPTADFSISLWMRTTDVTPAAIDYLFNQYNTVSNNRAWMLRLATDGTLLWYVSPAGDGTGAQSVPSTGGAISDNTWHFIVCTFTASTSLKIYIDGTLNNTNPTSIPSAVNQSSTSSLFVGSMGASSTNTFVGDLDEVALWNVALTDAEVSALYAGGAGKTFTDLP